jgi:RimJ/RimL family protein N-acetyltransferase
MGSIQPREYDLKSGETILVRDCSPREALKVLKYIDPIIHERGFLVVQPEEFKPDQKKERARIRKHRENSCHLFIVAESSGTIVGLLGINGLGDAPRKRTAHCAVLHLTVRKDWRDRGVGKVLVSAAMDWAKINPGLEKICLSVFADNLRAIHVYKKLGFSEEGRRKRQYKISKGKYIDELLMAKFVK